MIIVGSLLLSATKDFPDWGDQDSPANEGPVSSFYIEKTEEKTKVPNMVTAVLADYRGYDTMFETVVIFIAGIGIIAVLRTYGNNDSTPKNQVGDEGAGLLAKITCSLILPFIQLFALYVWQLFLDIFQKSLPRDLICCFQLKHLIMIGKF